MSSLVIEVFESGVPANTVRIPLLMLSFVSKLVPKQARNALAAQGVELQALIDAARSGQLKGSILDVTEHASNERVVISIA